MNRLQDPETPNDLDSDNTFLVTITPVGTIAQKKKKEPVGADGGNYMIVGIRAKAHLFCRYRIRYDMKPDTKSTSTDLARNAQQTLSCH